jgi:hypothetical protein
MIRPDVPGPDEGVMPPSLRDAYRATEPGRTAQPFADRAFRARIDQIATGRAAGGPLARLLRGLVGGPRLALNGAVLSAALILLSVGVSGVQPAAESEAVRSDATMPLAGSSIPGAVDSKIPDFAASEPPAAPVVVIGMTGLAVSLAALALSYRRRRA